jgi:hypothetical protein
VLVPVSSGNECLSIRALYCKDQFYLKGSHDSVKQSSGRVDSADIAALGIVEELHYSSAPRIQYLQPMFHRAHTDNQLFLASLWQAEMSTSAIHIRASWKP